MLHPSELVEEQVEQQASFHYNFMLSNIDQNIIVYVCDWLLSFFLQGTLSDQNTITIEGPRRAYGRFGHAMTGVGDVNADGFQGK